MSKYAFQFYLVHGNPIRSMFEHFNMFPHSLLTAFCLRDLKIFVPDAVIMGNAATLTCQYDLEKVSIRQYIQVEIMSAQIYI